MPKDLNLVNKLYYGDNLIIMREFIPDECVDLIYLDPPFNSKATYNVLFHEKDGSKGSETRDLMRIRTGADLPGTSQGFDCHRSAVH
jgi:DNA modification methylase